MPQMSPMHWMFLMFYFVSMFVLMIMYIYFTALLKLSFFLKKSYMLMKWIEYFNKSVFIFWSINWNFFNKLNYINITSDFFLLYIDMFLISILCFWWWFSNL